MRTKVRIPHVNGLAPEIEILHDAQAVMATDDTGTTVTFAGHLMVDGQSVRPPGVYEQMWDSLRLLEKSDPYYRMVHELKGLLGAEVKKGGTPQEISARLEALRGTTLTDVLPEPLPGMSEQGNEQVWAEKFTEELGTRIDKYARTAAYEWTEAA